LPAENIKIIKRLKFNRKSRQFILGRRNYGNNSLLLTLYSFILFVHALSLPGLDEQQQKLQQKYEKKKLTALAKENQTNKSWINFCTIRATTSVSCLK
jgi:hypothetical protein